MLLPPETRLETLLFPASLKRRAMIRHGKRKNKWGQKFKQHFSDKAAKKWRKRATEKGGLARLAEKSQGTAKVAPRMALAKLGALAKRLGKDLGLAKAAREEETKKGLIEVPDSPWLGKQVRMVREGPGEGRSGQVLTVLRVIESDPVEYALNVLKDTGSSKAGGIFQVRHPRVEEERADAVPAAEFKLDWRTLKLPARKGLAAELGIDTVEPIVEKHTLELGTVHAIFAELQLRFQPENTLLVPPSVALTFYEGGMPEDHRGEVANCLAEIASA
jgi:hypothetical protein